MTPANASRARARAHTRAHECLNCLGYLEPCAACIAAAGDPQPHEFATVLGPVWSCACGRHYGTFQAGSSVCFVMRPPHHREVRTCVRCRRDLRATHRLTDDGQQLVLPIDGR